MGQRKVCLVMEVKEKRELKTLSSIVNWKSIAMLKTSKEVKEDTEKEEVEEEWKKKENEKEEEERKECKPIFLKKHGKVK